MKGAGAVAYCTPGRAAGCGCATRRDSGWAVGEEARGASEISDRTRASGARPRANQTAGRERRVLAGRGTQKRVRKSAHLGTLLVLKSFLEDVEDSVGLEVHYEVRTAGEDAEGGLARVHVRAGHGKDLRLEGVPWAAALHGVVGEVCDGVDGLVAHDGGGFMEEGVEEDALEGGDGRCGELVVEREAVWGGRAEEETAEEDEREGAHLGRGRSRAHRRRKEILTSSVSAEVANWAMASKYSSGVWSRRSLTAFSALGRVQHLGSMRAGEGYLPGTNGIVAEDEV